MAFIGFEGYSLLNTGTIQGYPTSVMLLVIIAAQELDTNQQESKIFVALRNKLKEIKAKGFKYEKKYN